MSDIPNLLAGAEAVATLMPQTTIFLHGLIRRPILTADDVAVPLAGPELIAHLRAALSRRITTGSWRNDDT